MSAIPALSISGLRKSVPSGRLLFDGLALTVRPGEIVAIMGESGVGKSTLLNLIAGLDVADAGEIKIDGGDLSAMSDDQRTILRRDRIGFVFQAFHILPHLTLVQNAALPVLLSGGGEAQGLSRARALLAAVGLEGRAGSYPSELSGGEMQRVAIARALIHRPALILADEPTGNLDPESAEKVLTLFGQQTRDARAAAVIVTHSDRVAAVADRSLVLTAQGLILRGQ